MVYVRMLLVAAGLAASLLLTAPTGQAAGAPTAAPCRYFAETGHNLCDAFYAFYTHNGDMARFGLPLSEAFVEPGSGLAVQYFTYARFELHGERVELTRLGALAAAGREAEPPFAWLDPAAPLAAGRVFVPESGHSLGGAFGEYWQQHGGVALFGYPISEEFYEAQPDGAIELVQYFERSRFHYRGEAGSATVAVAPLGVWAADFVAPALHAPAEPVVQLAAAVLPYNPQTGAGHNIALAAQHLDGAVIAPGAGLSFLAAIGPITAAAGYREGTAIVGGQLVPDVGGGVCVVSTLLYRAAWRGGLPIVERSGHSYQLDWFADMPGVEAAVYDPGLDLRIANPTAQPIRVQAGVAGNRVWVVLWGVSAGRTVELHAPQISGSGAATVVVTVRTVRDAEGRSSSERVVTRYAVLPQVGD